MVGLLAQIIMKILVVTDKSKYSKQVLDTIIRAGKQYPDMEIIIAYLSRNITSEGKERLKEYVEQARSFGIKVEEDYVTFDFLPNACRYLCTLYEDKGIAAIFIASPIREVIDLLRKLCPDVNIEVVNILPILDEIMTKEVITASVETNVKEISIIMKKYKVGSVIITDGGKAHGIITESDLIKRVMADGKDPDKTIAGEVMTFPIIIGEYDMQVGEAAHLMASKRIKKLPVIKNGKLAGIITVSDLAYRFPKIATSITTNVNNFHSGSCCI